MHSITVRLRDSVSALTGSTLLTSIGVSAKSVNPNKIYFGSVLSNSLVDSLGSVTINLPSTFHSGNSSRTYVIASQLDSGPLSRARFSFSYDVAPNCQTATIYFRDVEEFLADHTPIYVSFVVAQD
jgi:hypothetical protein